MSQAELSVVVGAPRKYPSRPRQRQRVRRATRYSNEGVFPPSHVDVREPDLCRVVWRVCGLVAGFVLVRRGSLVCVVGTCCVQLVVFTQHHGMASAARDVDDDFVGGLRASGQDDGTGFTDEVSVAQKKLAVVVAAPSVSGAV